MPENYLFEYAVVRVVPRVEREEFLNAGVILYCAKLRYLKSISLLDEERTRIFCRSIDLDEVGKHLQAFVSICKGGNESGPIGKLDPASRFRWLTAARSTVIQTSKVHPGFCTDPEETLQRLFKQLVLVE